MPNVTQNVTPKVTLVSLFCIRNHVIENLNHKYRTYIKMRKTQNILILFVAFLFAGLTATAKNDFFQPSHKTTLRAPAVPLITSDPYLSIWSPYNTLTEGNTQHWTGEAHPLIGAVRVDGQVYRFMGKDRPQLLSVIPSSPPLNGKPTYWTAVYTFEKPNGNWTDVNYNDNAWKLGEAAFGTNDMPRVKTSWTTKDIWIRRTFNLDEDISKEHLILQYSHDDIFELYLNGERIVKTDYTWKNDVLLVLTDKIKKKLKKGKNVLAAHCHNKTGGAYVDFGLLKKGKVPGFELEAVQQSVDVLPTQSYYNFICGPVSLDLVFTAPLLLDDLQLLSTPINYISYRIRSLDNKEHDVQVYFETTPQLAVNDLSQPVVSEQIEKNGLTYLKTGTIDQPITKRVGDGVRIDWGYAYLTSEKEDNKESGIGDYYEMKESFIQTGSLIHNAEQKIQSFMPDGIPVLAYCDRMGKVKAEGKSGFIMLGYDDIYSIEYFYKRRLAYWKQHGKIDIFQAFEQAKNDYASVMERCRIFDHQLIEEAQKAGGTEYAELCALAYRHSIAAHKLITDDDGTLLFLSKENHSNGCINTVDLTYPSAPLYLLYNPELLKGMMNSIFYYSESGRWNKPYPAHDLGTYPVSNGQLYGEDMPVEEAGNMILLATAICKIEGNADYALKHWNTLTTWTNYLVEKGLDPENQLCTDDFAGHLAHNSNLSVKAILAIGGYGHIAKMAGKHTIGDEYIQKAKDMAIVWQMMANDGDHYKLAFDKSGTWSQKYNMVWDKLFQLGIFDPSIMDTEISFYLNKQKKHKYGLPLDSRKNYTKSDWVLWTACMSPDTRTFQQLVAPIYKYANETTSRVPISDWHDTDSGEMMNFKARSVVGAYFMKMLFDRVRNPENIELVNLNHREN